MNDFEIKHYGVLGMHWGIRRRRKEYITSIRGRSAIISRVGHRKYEVNKNPTKEDLSRVIATHRPVSALFRNTLDNAMKKIQEQKSKRPPSEDFSNARSLGKKKPYELSNAELKALTTRLQLEKQYKDLTKKEQTQAAKAVQEVLVGVGKTALSSYLMKNVPIAVRYIFDQIQNRTG